MENGTEHDLNEFLVKNIIDVKNIDRVSHNNSRFNSYKITVSVIDFNRILDEYFWPDGIQCKKWYERKDSSRDNYVNDDVFNNDAIHDNRSGQPFGSNQFNNNNS